MWKAYSTRIYTRLRDFFRGFLVFFCDFRRRVRLPPFQAFSSSLLACSKSACVPLKFAYCLSVNFNTCPSGIFREVFWGILSSSSTGIPGTILFVGDKILDMIDAIYTLPIKTPPLSHGYQTHRHINVHHHRTIRMTNIPQTFVGVFAYSFDFVQHR